MEHNRDGETTGEIYGKSNFADFPLNFDNYWQKNSSQSNQCNRTTISDQKDAQIA